jgi:hypothetical protein
MFGQSLNGRMRSVMATAVRTSLTRTQPSRLQSPTSTGGVAELVAGDCSGVGVGLDIFEDPVAVAHEQHPGFAGLSGTQISSGLQTGFSMQSRQGRALHPARIVGQGTQWVAQHVVMPSVGAHVGSVGVKATAHRRGAGRGHSHDYARMGA